MAIDAKNDITNYGKLVGDKLVYLSADNDINLLSSTRTQIRGNNAGKGPTANKPLDKTELELQHGKGNVEQGGGNYKETKDKILDNQAANQKANESSKFGEHVAKEQQINAGKGTGGYLNKPEQGGTLNIGAGNKPIEGAYNISNPAHPMANGVHAGDINDLSNIATGSQRKIIMENPYGFNPLNKEVLRVLEPEGTIVIKGSGTNRTLRNIEAEAARNGLILVSKKDVPNIGYNQTSGAPIKGDVVIEYIFKRK